MAPAAVSGSPSISILPAPVLAAVSTVICPRGGKLRPTVGYMVARKASAGTGVGVGVGEPVGVGEAVGMGVGVGFTDAVFDTPPHPNSASSAKDARNDADVPPNKPGLRGIKTLFLGNLHAVMPAAHHEFA